MARIEVVAFRRISLVLVYSCRTLSEIINYVHPGSRFVLVYAFVVRYYSDRR
jgi:hypothetical protein